MATDKRYSPVGLRKAMLKFAELVPEGSVGQFVDWISQEGVVRIPNHGPKGPDLVRTAAVKEWANQDGLVAVWSPDREGMIFTVGDTLREDLSGTGACPGCTGNRDGYYRGLAGVYGALITAKNECANLGAVQCCESCRIYATHALAQTVLVAHLKALRPQAKPATGPELCRCQLQRGYYTGLQGVFYARVNEYGQLVNPGEVEACVTCEVFEDNEHALGALQTHLAERRIAGDFPGEPVVDEPACPCATQDPVFFNGMAGIVGALVDEYGYLLNPPEVRRCHCAAVEWATDEEAALALFNRLAYERTVGVWPERPAGAQP